MHHTQKFANILNSTELYTIPIIFFSQKKHRKNVHISHVKNSQQILNIIYFIFRSISEN